MKEILEDEERKAEELAKEEQRKKEEMEALQKQEVSQ